MTVDEALKVAAKLFPRGTLACRDAIDEEPRYTITHNGKLVGSGRDWPEAFRAARERRPPDQPSLF